MITRICQVDKNFLVLCSRNVTSSAIACQNSGVGTDKTTASQGPTMNTSSTGDGKQLYQSQHVSLDAPLKQRLTDYKRGRGGRSSFNGMVATVFGASGFLGRHLVNALGKVGTQVICPYRGDPYDAKDLKLMGDLGQVLFMPYHLENEASIRKAVKHSNVVINLVGKFHPTKNFSLQQVQVDGAARLARISREMGVKEFMHVSALNADKSPKSYIAQKGAEFLRTKALGEEAVLNEFPDATIIKPSYMWGQRDSLLFYFMKPFRVHKLGPQVYIPLYQSGKGTIKQPIAATDVAQGIVKIMQNDEYKSKVYQMVGPSRYQMCDLVRYIYLHLRYDSESINLIPMNPLLLAKVKWTQTIQPIYPPVTIERLEFEAHTDKVDFNLPIFNDLGIVPKELEDSIAWELKPFRRHGYYWDALGEFPEPPRPPIMSV